MGITDFFKKKKKGDDGKESSAKQKMMAESMSQVDTSKLSVKEKMAFKMFQKMPQKKQEDILRQAMDPQQIQKNKDKILKQIDEMVKNGQIDKGQAEAVKSRMGLR
jgi:ribosomal protein S20